MTYFYYFRGVPLEIYGKLVMELKRRSLRELREEEIIVRPLRPEDLGLGTPEWTFNIITTTWNVMINTTIADLTWIGIYGILYAISNTQAVSQLEIVSMGNNERYWQIQGCNFTENSSFFFDDPVIIDQNTNITINGYGVANGATEKICFLGVVVEKKGILIQGTDLEKNGSS